MPDFSVRDSILLKLTDYWKTRRNSKNSRRSSADSYELKSNKRVTIWDYNQTINTARHTFMPGHSDSPLRGRCSMLKVVVKEDMESSHNKLTIFGRTDLVCEKSGMVTHANWRRDLPLPFRITLNNVRCYAQQGCVIVDLNLSP